MRAARTILMLASAALCPLASGQKPANTPTSVYLHAWYPEMGPLPEPALAEDKELIEVASAGRAGAYRSAMERMKAFFGTYTDPRSLYLSLLFERELLIRQTLLVSGGRRAQGEEVKLALQILPQVAGIESRIQSVINSIDPQDREPALAVNFYSTVAFRCLVEQPSLDHYAMVGAEAPEYASFRAPKSAPSKCTEDVRKVNDKFPSSLDEASRELFQVLVEATEKQGRWEFEAARSAYEKGLRLGELKSPSTAALWMLHLGDLSAAPYGSPLSMGLDLANDHLIRPLLDSRVKKARTEAEWHQARQWYGQAAALIPRGPQNPELLLRAGFVAWMQFDRGALAIYRQAASAAHNNSQPRLEAMALGSASIVSPDPALFRNALSVGAEQQDVGTAASLGEMALAGAWRARVGANPLRAIHILDSAIDAFQNSNLSYTAIELTELASQIERSYGRNDRVIRRLDQSVALHKAWIAQCERVSSTEDRDTLTTAAKRQLGEVLQVLAAAIQERLAEEGLDAWERRLEAVEKELAEFQSLIPPDPKLDDLKHRSAESYRLWLDQKRADCATLIDIYRRSANPTVASYPAWLQKAIPAARCDPAIKREAAATFVKVDVLGPWLLAVEEWRKSNSVLAGFQIESEFRRFDDYGAPGALALGNGDLLANWAGRIEHAVSDNLAALNMIGPYAELYRATAQLSKGEATEARETLKRVRSEEPFWSSDIQSRFRSTVSRLLASAENSLNHPMSALLALEWYRLEELRSQELENGLRAREPASVELEMLIRQAAMGAKVDQARIRELTAKTPALRKESMPLPEEADLLRQIAQLPSRTVVLVYQDFDDRVVLWRLQRNQDPVGKTLAVKWNEVQAAKGQLNGRLMNRESGWQSTANLLWKSLIVPAGEIPEGWTIAILRPPGMEAIPFDTLGPDENDQLIGKHPIVYLTALTSIVAKADSLSATGRPVVIGQSSQTLEELDREVEDVAGRIGATVLSGPQARIADVTSALETARFAHIAAHAVIDQSNPYRSYLAMADGPLEAWELFQHSRANELLVLSACDSSRGAAQAFSGGRASLTSLALLAGARRIVSSQWKANDYESRLLMRSFYENLHDDPALALQQAKTSTGIPSHHFANFILTVRDPTKLRF